MTASIKGSIGRIAYFFLLTICFSSCTSSCDCKVDSIACSGAKPADRELIRSFENDTIQFVSDTGSVLTMMFSSLDSGLSKEVSCYKKNQSGCYCDDCFSNYGIQIEFLNQSKVKNGNVYLFSKQYHLGAPSTDGLSEVFSELVISISDFGGVLKLPLTGKSIEGKQEYFEELSLGGKKFNKVYRLFSSRSNYGELVEELPGSFYFTEKEKIIGFIDPDTEELFVIE